MFASFFHRRGHLARPAQSRGAFAPPPDPFKRIGNEGSGGGLLRVPAGVCLVCSWALWSDPYRGSWPSALRVSLPRLIWSDPYRGSWLPTPRMSSRCRCRGSFSVTPIEDRGFRPSGCRFRGSFGVTPVEDRGFRLPGCPPGVASEAHLESPLSRIMAVGAPVLIL